MKKEEFKDGTQFIYKNKTYRQTSSTASGGYLTHGCFYECTIEKIGTKLMYCFDVVMGKLVNITIRLEDCELKPMTNEYAKGNKKRI